jgi:guanylate kinase
MVVSGPSGSGKSSLLNRLIKNSDNIHFSISTTTRKKREREIEGVDYYFVDEEKFKEDIKNGLFLEWAKVHGHYYGTSLTPIIKALGEGKLVVFDIDVQGQKIVRQKFESITTSVFLTTPNISELRSRLKDRGTDSDENIEKRLSNALGEMTNIHEYDYILINDDYDDAYERLLAISKVSKLKTSIFDIENFISKWVNA